MFKKSALVLGRCTLQGCLRSRCVRWHHLAKIQEPLTANVKTNHGYRSLINFKTKGIFLDQNSHRDGRPTPKILEDGSIGVIHVPENESASLVNPMERRFLHDLEFQQVQRIEEIKKDKDNQDDIGSLTQEITMSKGKGGKDPCKKEDPCKSKKKDKKKKKKKGDESKKCKELAQREKCKKLAKADQKKKMMKKCKELVQQEKCKKMAKKAKSKKGKGKKGKGKKGKGKKGKGKKGKGKKGKKC